MPLEWPRRAGPQHEIEHLRGVSMPPQLRGRALGHALDGVEFRVFLNRRGHQSISCNARSVSCACMDDGQMEIVGHAHLPVGRERSIAVALHDAGLRDIHLPFIAIATKALDILHAANAVHYVHVRHRVRLIGERPARGRAVAGEHVAGGGDLRRAAYNCDFVGKVGRVFSVLDTIDGSADALAHGEASAARRRVEADQVIA